MGGDCCLVYCCLGGAEFSFLAAEESLYGNCCYCYCYYGVCCALTVFCLLRFEVLSMDLEGVDLRMNLGDGGFD